MLEIAPVSRSLVSAAVESFGGARTGLDDFFAVLRAPIMDPAERSANGSAALADIVRHAGGAKEAVRSARAAAATEMPGVPTSMFDDAEAGVTEIGTFAQRMLDTKGHALVDPTLTTRQAGRASANLEELATSIARAGGADLDSAAAHVASASTSAGRSTGYVDQFIGVLRTEINPHAKYAKGMTALQDAGLSLDESLKALRSARQVTDLADDAGVQLLDTATTNVDIMRAMLSNLAQPRGSSRVLDAKHLELASTQLEDVINVALRHLRNSADAAAPVRDSLAPVFQRPVFASA